MLAYAPAPAELTALTLNVCVPYDRLLKVWLRDSTPCTVVHEPPLCDTSYLIRLAPPLFSGACQVSVTFLPLTDGLRLRGAPGTFARAVNTLSTLSPEP